MILKRNIILLIVTVVFIILSSSLRSFLYYDKYELISDLEDEQKIANEKFITAQILSEKLNQVYNLFESNLATNNSDSKNKESNMGFLKELTDILNKLEIKLLQMEPGGTERKGLITKIAYSMEIKCTFEEFGKLITELESNDRLITIEEITMKNGVEKIKGNTSEIEEIQNLIVILEINTVTINKAKV